MRVAARRTSLFSFAFAITAEDMERGNLRHRMFGRPGLLHLDGIDYEITRDGPFGTKVEVVGNPGEVARVVRTGTLKRAMMFTWPGGVAVMRRPGFGWRHELTDGDRVIGSVKGHAFTMTLDADVPDDMPLPAVALVLWMLIRRRRQASAASGGGG